MTSTHGRLAASFVLLNDDRGNEVLLGSVDTLFVSRKLLGDLQQAIDLPSLLLFATHTHNAPSLAQELPLLGGVSAAWYAKVLEVLAAELKALLDRKPVQVAVAYGAVATHLNINRRKYGYVLDYGKLRRGELSLRKQTSLAPDAAGMIDSRVRLFSLQSGDATRAVLWSFAAHPAFYPLSRAASADFPGMVREELTRSLAGECCVIYLPGLAGSAIPRMRQRLLMRPSEYVRRLLPFNPMLPSHSRRTYSKWVAKLVGAVRHAHEHRQIVTADGALTLRHEQVPEIFADTDGGRRLDLRASYLGFADHCGILAYSGEMLGEWSEYLAGLPLERIIA